MSQEEIQAAQWIDRDNERRAKERQRQDRKYRAEHAAFGRTRDLVDSLLDYDSIGRVDAED